MRRRLRAAGRHVWDDAVVALPGWITARVLVLSALPYARFVFDHARAAAPKLRLHEGLLAWDGQWYERIARHGYAGIPRTGVRFFPLYPLAARALGVAFAHRYDVALLVLANGPALLLGALLVRLVRREGGDEPAAVRATWFVALVPPAFVLVWGYSEALAGCLAVAAFLALRSKRWWWAAAAGFLSGLARPSGAVLAVPALVEAARGVRGASGREVMSRMAAVAAPVAGVATYLGWVGLRFGNALLPVQVQEQSWLRGRSVDPLLSLYRAGQAAFAGHLGGNGIHFPLTVLAVALVVVVFRRWPASYGAYALASLLVALSASRLGSAERYIFSTFPFVLGLVSLTRSKRVELATLVTSGACMAGFATLALLGAYVP
ncbi:MAG: hypothetical protein JO265_02235 [Acidimicrobiia bacterium]|nr:hypothetical protein [Acidimicrobiia bacterium]